MMRSMQIVLQARPSDSAKRTDLRIEGRIIQNSAPGSDDTATMIPKATDNAIDWASDRSPILPMVSMITALSPAPSLVKDRQ